MKRVVVFDMGGVLYDFQGDRLMRQISQKRWRGEEEHATWSPLLHRFEVGAVSETEFAEEVRGHYDLSLNAPEFLAAFRAAARGFYPGALELVRGLGRDLLVLSLSNSNAAQWPQVLAHLGDADPFHAHYPSHRSGFRKPDPRAFRALAMQLDPAARYYFLDDLPENVAAASSLGWHARRVRGVQEARRACHELGLFDDEDRVAG